MAQNRTMKQALIDTNILSYFLKGNVVIDERVRRYLREYDFLSFSTITYYEIKNGLIYRDARGQMERFDRLAQTSEILDFDLAIADIASQIHSTLRAKGGLVTPSDIFIGATAISYDYTLITANTKDFQNMPGLRYENWAS